MTLDPTIITKDYLDLETNYEEYYAPIFRILLYESELDLKNIFQIKNIKKKIWQFHYLGNHRLLKSCLLH